MRLRARKDWENADGDVDTGNYYEFLPLKYRFMHWDGWHNLRRAIKHHSMLEIRWYRHFWYKYLRKGE